MTVSEPLIGKNHDVTNFEGDEHTLFTFMVGGAAGDGIMSAGKLFSTMISRNNYYSQYYTEYPSLIRGGHNMVIVRVADKPVHCQVSYVDILFALNQETIEIHIDEITKGGSIIYDPRILRRKSPEDFNRPDIEWRAIPLREITMEMNAAKIVRNTIGIAGAIAMIDLPLVEIQDLLKQMFARKPAVAEINSQAAERGYSYMKENYGPFKVTLEDRDDEGLMTITGNEATAAGFIAGGINIYTGYPMSPATSLLETMVKYSDEYDYMTVQAEDEISAVTMAIGSNHAGARAATGTSGGGVALMTEAIGLAGSAEIPLVVVNVMRPGPSTGLPTWTGQGDLNFSLYLGQDSFPRIVLAPGDVEECFNLAAEALNYAEEYQVPVLFLTDKWVGSSGFSSQPFGQENISIRTGKTYLLSSKVDEFEDYNRFELTDDGISPRAIPGLSENMIFKTTGNEHDELGRVDDSGPNRVVQMEKRMKKLETIQKDFPNPVVYGSAIEDADITVISWGSNKGILLDTLDRLPEMKIAFIHITHIWPFPRKFMVEMIDKSHITVVAEQNYDGQMAQLIRNHCLRSIDHTILRYDGRPFDPIDLANKLQHIIKLSNDNN